MGRSSVAFPLPECSAQANAGAADGASSATGIAGRIYQHQIGRRLLRLQNHTLPQKPKLLGFPGIMPTALTIFGLRVVIYVNDHRPVHVHIMGSGCEAVFNLHCPHGPPKLRENYGFSHKMLGKIADALAGNLTALCARWIALHGNF